MFPINNNFFKTQISQTVGGLSNVDQSQATRQPTERSNNQNNTFGLAGNNKDMSFIISRDRVTTTNQICIA